MIRIEEFSKIAEYSFIAWNLIATIRNYCFL